MATAKEQKQTPFALLQSLEQRGRDHRSELPAQEELRTQWSGIGFRLGRTLLIVPMAEVTEILTYPQLSQVPRTKAWVKGIANVRGTLLPVMDLNGYLGKRGATLTRLSRVLVIHSEGLVSGVLVDEVLGMRHFYEEDRLDSTDGVDEVLRPYVSGAYRRGGEVWYVFSGKALAEDPQFLKVAS